MSRWTNFPNGITSMGVPTLGAGALLPFPGNYYFVNETTGLDGNPGTAAQPLKTLSRALTLCTAGNNDVVLFEGTIHVSDTLAWNKDFVHLIGLTAPSVNPRARISQAGSTVFTPLVNVTAQGCIFANLGTYHGFNDASAQVCWAEAGQRNYYYDVLFGGMADATAAAQAGSRSLTVGAAGQGENVFENCIIGLDTVVRATGNNASLEFLGASPRNIFRGCVFQADVSNAADTHVTVGVGGIDRWAQFIDCLFTNAEFGGPGATAMTVAFSVNVSAGGAVILQRCTSLGAGKISAAGPVYVDGGPPTGTTTGLAVAAS